MQEENTNTEIPKKSEITSLLLKNQKSIG